MPAAPEKQPQFQPPRTAGDIGRAAEQRAADFLQTQGVRLLQRNYRCRMGEIDLIGLHGTTLSFIEVRLRSTARFGGAAASITPAKCRKLRLTAGHFLARHPGLRSRAARFDAVLVPADERQPPQWLQNLQL